MIKSFTAIAAALCFAIMSFGCGGATTNTTNNATANRAANATTTTATSSTTTTPANAETVKADSVGVPECDEYIRKYEACLTTIAAKAPQAVPGLKSGFEAQRSGFKAAASTPQGKTMLATQCKGFIETAKKNTSEWCTNW